VGCFAAPLLCWLWLTLAFERGAEDIPFELEAAQAVHQHQRVDKTGSTDETLPKQKKFECLRQKNRVEEFAKKKRIFSKDQTNEDFLSLRGSIVTRKCRIFFVDHQSQVHLLPCDTKAFPYRHTL
jgi:hypothetical protein